MARLKMRDYDLTMLVAEFQCGGTGERELSPVATAVSTLGYECGGG